MTAARGRRIGAVAAALAIASIAVSMLALGARTWWIAELFTHFRLQLFTAQAVLLAVLLATRFRALAAGVALCAAVNAWYLYPVAWPDGRALAGAGDELRVMTVNVSVRNDTADTLLATIEREQPDLILVVELTQRWASHLAVLDDAYAHRELIAGDDAFGIGLLSRYPITAASADELGPTPAIDARVEGPNGPFRVLGAHLMPPTSGRLAAERNRQLEELAERRAAIEGPLVVLGDFNVSPYSPYYREWVAETGLVDTLAGHGPGATWPSFLPVLGIPIDHCLVSTHFTVVGRRHLPAFGSDHYPVLVRLLQESDS